MFAPDVQGPMSTRTLELIKAAKPQVLFLGGPPFYLGGFKVDESQLQMALKNLTSIVEVVPVTVLEHHALRDESWQKRTRETHDAAIQAGHQILTAAEFAGEKNRFLESTRKQLYAEAPPSKEFERWMHLNPMEKSKQKPPL